MINTKKSQITEEQHYVPKFYLRKFSNSKNVLERLDLKQKQIIDPRGPKGLCKDRYFYGQVSGEHDEISQKMEEYFQLYESHIAKNIDIVINKILCGEHMSQSEKWSIALLMSILLIRGPVMRDQINNMTTDMMKRISKFAFSHPSVHHLFDEFDADTGTVTSPKIREEVIDVVKNGEYDLKVCNYFHLQMFDKFHGFANLFSGQHWTVFINKSDRAFIASDNPIAVSIPERKSCYGPSFLERTHHFALTPDILIVARYAKNATGKNFKRLTLFSNSKEEILNLNMIVSDKAYRYVYSQNRNSLEDILNRVSDQEKQLKTLRENHLKLVIARQNISRRSFKK